MALGMYLRGDKAHPPPKEDIPVVITACSWQRGAGEELERRLWSPRLQSISGLGDERGRSRSALTPAATSSLEHLGWGAGDGVGDQKRVGSGG